VEKEILNMKTAKLAILFLAGTFMLFASHPTAARPASSLAVPATSNLDGPADPAEIESFLDQLFSQQMEEFHLAGITAVMVKDGQVLFQKGYGYSDLENRIPVDPAKTLFRIGSVTKLFTWTAVLQLVEQGKLDLDADINTYLDFHIPDTFPEPITLKHLMSHTAGFEERAYEALARTPDQIPPLGKFLATHIPARIYPPGEVSIYSDYGADLAGYIIERASGMPYADYIEANILDPLGLAHTTLRQPLPAYLAANMSIGYQYTQNDLQPIGFGLMSTQPSGDIRSTAGDMALFMIAHLQGGCLCPDDRWNVNTPRGSILKAATEQLMQSSLWGPDPRMAGYTHGFMELHFNGQRILHHGGDAAGFHSLLMLLPDQNLGLFVSYNTTSPGFAWVNTLYSFMDHYYSGEPAANQPAPDFTSDAEIYAGGYLPARSSHTTIEKVDELVNWMEITDSGDGSLLIGSPLSPQKARLDEVEPMLFRESSTGSQVVFQRDDQGKIAYLYDAVFPFASLVKAPWHANPILHLGLLGASALIFLSVLLAGFFGGIHRLIKRVDRAAQPALARLALWLSTMVALLDFSALIAFLVITLFNNEFMTMITYGRISTINIILAAWLLAAVLTIGLAAMTVLVWRKGFWGVTARVHYTLTTLAALSFVWFLNYWNLLGFRY
jgi:CubicO group peptidase (beta-lactamase class C family)